MIQLYTQQSINELIWPATKEGEFAQKYLLNLMQQGSSAFIKNAKTQLFVIKINDKIIPITVNNTEYENSYLLSNYFVITQLHERKHFILKPLINILGSLLKLCKINKVVIINNWLMSTNPYPELSNDEVAKIVQLLITHFPHHYFMFRSITRYGGDPLFKVLQNQQFHLLFSRNVYLYDTNQQKKLSNRMVRKQSDDFNRIVAKQYQLEEVTQLSTNEESRILDLYKQVYIDKHTKYSPQYSSLYLQELLKNKLIKLKVLKKEGKIYGAAGFFQKERFLLTAFFGYDTSLPQEEGLYRMLSGVIMEETKTAQLIGHQGSGAPDFKLWRGCTQEAEYTAIFDKHLPFHRRLFWSLAKKYSLSSLLPKSNK